MSRQPRVKNVGDETVYHLCGRVNGEKNYYPFEDRNNSAYFMEKLKDDG